MNEWNEVLWLNSRAKLKGGNNLKGDDGIPYSYRKLQCPYKSECNCNYQLRVECYDNNEMSILEGPVRHSAHDEAYPVKPGSGIPLLWKKKLYRSASDVKSVTPQVAVDSLRGEHNLSLKEKQAQRVRDFVKKKRALDSKKSLLEGQDKLTYGAVMQRCQEYICDLQEGQNGSRTPAPLHEHKGYLLGHPYFNPDLHGKPVFFAVMSTDNLLMNAYRQSSYGQPVFFAVDTSYKYTWEGFGLYPVCTVDLQQKTHVIAYALLNCEKADVQTLILQRVRKYVEEVVKERQTKEHERRIAQAQTNEASIAQAHANEDSESSSVT